MSINTPLMSCLITLFVVAFDGKPVPWWGWVAVFLMSFAASFEIGKDKG